MMVSPCEDYLGRWEGTKSVDGHRIWRVVDYTLGGTLILLYGGRRRWESHRTREQFEQMIRDGNLKKVT